MKELETALSDVEEIDGSLKIVRSFPIVSLSFFRNLKRIRGIKAPDDRDNTWYSLYVMDNQNLQDLFPNPVTIDHGKIFFHFNPKLCYSNIEKLKNGVVELRNVTSLAIEDVATNSNGDKVACKCFYLVCLGVRSFYYYTYSRQCNATEGYCNRYSQRCSNTILRSNAVFG